MNQQRRFCSNEGRGPTSTVSEMALQLPVIVTAAKS
jgi:hypothetical protein